MPYTARNMSTQAMTDNVYFRFFDIKFSENVKKRKIILKSSKEEDSHYFLYLIKFSKILAKARDTFLTIFLAVG